MRLGYMVEVVGKSNDPVVQCENCRNLVKYVENDVEYTTKHFNKENIEFSKKNHLSLLPHGNPSGQCKMDSK